MNYDDEGNLIDLDDNDEGDGDRKVSELNAQKQHLKEKLAKKDELLAKEKAEKEALQKKLDEIGGTASKTAETVGDIQLKSQHSLDDSDLRVLKGIAVGAGKTPADILGDKESEAYKDFDSYRQAKSATKSKDEVIPPPSDRTPVVGEKTFSELDKGEKQKNYASTFDKLIGKARGSHNRNLS